MTREEIVQALEEPFDPDLLYWKPQAVNKDKTRAVAAVYADPRAYADRLSSVVGPGGWNESYTIVTTPYIKPGWKDKPATNGHKVMVVCTVHIDGVGCHSSTGESDASDENAATSAEAQAFKRACTKFGLGRYLYDFPKNQWCPYDEKTRRITEPPDLPDWAVPTRKCEDCTKNIQPFTYLVGKPDQEGNQDERTLSVSELVANSKRKYQKELCADCQKIRADEAKRAAGGRL